jgi:hypothetical protein
VPASDGKKFWVHRSEDFEPGKPIVGCLDPVPKIRH